MKGLYFHVCPECREEFWGRKNKVYCSDECRHRKNNRTAQLRRKPTEKDVKDLRSAHLILDELYSVHDERWFDVSSFQNTTLESQFPHRMMSDKNDQAWVRVGDIAFFVTGQKVKLYKFNQDEI